MLRAIVYTLCSQPFNLNNTVVYIGQSRVHSPVYISYMASNLTLMNAILLFMNAKDTPTSGFAPQITSTNAAGIRTKEMNLSLKNFSNCSYQK